MVMKYKTKREKHGMSQKSEYLIWRDLKQACYNPKFPRYKELGAQGVTICERWLNSFSDFYNDVFPRPSLKHRLDIIDKSIPFGPNNFVWDFKYSKQKEIKMVSLTDGRIVTIAEAAKISGYSLSTVYNRYKNNEAVEV